MGKCGENTVCVDGELRENYNQKLVCEMRKRKLYKVKKTKTAVLLDWFCSFCRVSLSMVLVLFSPGFPFVPFLTRHKGVG